MKLNDISLGQHNPIRSPSSGLVIGDAVIEGLGPVSFGRGGGPTDMSIKIWVKSDAVIAGFAIGSQAGNEALARWCEEMSRNVDLQSMLVRWSSARALPQDGWWLLTACQPDYQFTSGGAIPIQMTFRQRAQLGAPLSTFWSGGNLTTVYTATPVNLVGLPQTATDAGTFVRTGAEGSYPVVLNPPGPGPVNFLPGATLDDLFKAACSCYDVTGGLGANPVPVAGLAVNANWLEARGTDHYFTGDVVLTNGILLLTVTVGGAVQLWCWNTVSGNWTLGGSIQTFDNTGIQGVPQSARLTRVSDEEVGVEVLYVGSVSTALISFRLQRAQKLARVGFSPRSYANTTAGSIRFAPAVGGAMVVYNETVTYDQILGSGVLAPTAVYPYAAAFLASASWQMIVSLLYQARIASEKPTQQPSVAASGFGIQLGDTTGPAQYQTRFYGIGLTGFATAVLRGEAELAILANMTNVVDAAASNGRTAQAASGLAVTATSDQINTDTILPAGTYRVVIRARVTSAASALTQMTFAVHNTDLGGAVLSANLAANAFAVGYTLVTLGTFTANGTQRYHTYAQFAYGGTALATDWFIDEILILPITLTGFKDGPQELAQQFLFERTTRSPVV